MLSAACLACCYCCREAQQGLFGPSNLTMWDQRYNVPSAFNVAPLKVGGPCCMLRLRRRQAQLCHPATAGKLTACPSLPNLSSHHCATLAPCPLPPASCCLPALPSLQVAYEIVDLCVRPALLGGALVWHLREQSEVQGQPGATAEQRAAPHVMTRLTKAWRSTLPLQNVARELIVSTWWLQIALRAAVLHTSEGWQEAAASLSLPASVLLLAAGMCGQGGGDNAAAAERHPATEGAAAAGEEEG